MKNKCDGEKLVRYLEHDLDASESGVVEEHLTECASCRKAADELNLGLAAALSLMEAEAQNLSRTSTASAAMSRIRGEKSLRAVWWPRAAAAILAGVLATTFFFGRGERKNATATIPPKPAALKVATVAGLDVRVEGDGLVVDDRLGEKLRTVDVKP